MSFSLYLTLVSLQNIKKLFEELNFDKAKVDGLQVLAREDDVFFYYKARGTVSFESKDARGFEQVIKV